MNHQARRTGQSSHWPIESPTPGGKASDQCDEVRKLAFASDCPAPMTCHIHAPLNAKISAAAPPPIQATQDRRISRSVTTLPSSANKTPAVTKADGYENQMPTAPPIASAAQRFGSRPRCQTHHASIVSTSATSRSTA